uniref:IBD domain-containing protein n=1 Tax=Parastrongyloides trichosuri TaxID=131310 RepID=A0A0N4ZQ08_PARTI
MSSPQSLDSSSSLSSDNSFDSTVSYQQSNIECTPVKSRKVEIKKHLIKEQINSGVYNKCIKPIPSYYEACQFVIDHIDSEVINFTMRMLMNPENASICHWTKYCWEFVIIDADSFVSAFCHEFDLNRNIITIAHLSKVYRTIGNNNIYGQCIIERVKCRRNAFRLFPKHQSFTYPKLKDFGNNSLATTFFKDEEKKVLIKLRNMQSKVPIFDRKRKGSGQSLSKNVENNGKVPRYEFHPYAGAY